MTTFDDIFGQDRAIDWLKQAWRADRLPHGLLFAGPAGVGKATTARALSALFLCERPKAADPCGKCESCTVMAADNHPDFRLIYRQLRRLQVEKSVAKDLSIEVLREFLIKPAGNKPMMGRGKVFVVEEADLMNTHGQNALLKTLEEPEGRTLLILLTDQPNALLPTIRSRCQLLRFAPLESKLVRRELEKRGISAPDATDAAAFADGSLGLALRWLEDGVVTHARELTERLDALLCGRAPADLPDWLKAACDQYAAKQQERDELVSKDQATREALSLYLRLASQHFRRQLDEQTDPETLEQLCAAIGTAAQCDLYADANVTVSLIFQQFAAKLETLFARTTPATR